MQYHAANKSPQPEYAKHVKSKISIIVIVCTPMSIFITTIFDIFKEDIHKIVLL